MFREQGLSVGVHSRQLGGRCFVTDDRRRLSVNNQKEQFAGRLRNSVLDPGSLKDIGQVEVQLRLVDGDTCCELWRCNHSCSSFNAGVVEKYQSWSTFPDRNLL
jgi:hypothetical protein